MPLPPCWPAAGLCDVTVATRPTGALHYIAAVPAGGEVT